ncbi:chorion peroxidase-like, partial [Littorina saxatilis]|uniref:chorion peroxidase-like n=1 Tax=Littorina saxatilis TaxID=31220 RepID=UPI0038B5EA0C
DSNTKISFLPPELCHPTTTGLMKARAENFTVNMDRSCSLLNFDTKYRTMDGTCNNPFNLGAATKALSRVISPQYEDGEELPRMFGVTGKVLPSGRLISKVIHPDVESNTRFSILLMQWGQFMDHDMVSTPLPVEDTRRTIKCCSEDRTHVRKDADPECFPIMFRPEKNFKGNCMEFVRSMPLKDRLGKVQKPREHMNVVTSFIDASILYGSTDERLEEVKHHAPGKGYLLNMTDDDYLPNNGMDDCIKRNDGDHCFLAGDERVNEHPGLTVMHTVFARLHNRIAHMLHYMRPFYAEEEVFQRTRKIVGALVQKIMYADWLPIILGPASMKRRGLAVGPGVERPEYSSMIDPSIPSSFGAAVFRFGHTLIPRTIPVGNQKPLLRDLFFKPFMVRDNVENIVEGMATGIDHDTRSQMPDAFIVEEVTDHLFETEEGVGKGFDLIALNIQRARDHGIPPYNDFRDHCGLRRITSFYDPAMGISQKALHAVYDHPDDIDLFSGGIVEPLAYGGLVGETFNCLMSEVFSNLKYGDRFFYETRGQKGSFEDDELAELRKVTLSQILCQTTGIREIQLNAFLIPSKDNPRVSCDWLVKQGMNLGSFVRHW